MVASKFASLAESADLPVSVVPTPQEEDFFAALNVPAGRLSSAPSAGWCSS